MLVFASRSRRSDPHLEWKVRIFSVAAVLMLVGIYFEERWMTMGALGLLVVAMGLRFLPGASSPMYDEEEEEEEEEEIDGE